MENKYVELTGKTSLSPQIILRQMLQQMAAANAAEKARSQNLNSVEKENKKQ